MGRIQTGVDKLVALIKEKHKISLDDAAKILGVSKTVVTEWADFLEEESLIEIKYSFTKTFFLEKTQGAAVVAERERAQTAQRETFIKNSSVTIANAERESNEAEAFRRELYTMRKELTSSLETLDRDLATLRSIEKTKAKNRENLLAKRDSLKRKEIEATRLLSTEYARYHAMLRDAAVNERFLAQHRAQVASILRAESRLSTTAKHYAGSVATLRAKLIAQSRALAVKARTLKGLEQRARSLRAHLIHIEKRTLLPIVHEREALTRATKALEQRILAKARAARAHAKRSGTTVKARRTLEELFRRKRRLEHTIEEIDRDKRALLVELDALTERAKQYSPKSSSARGDLAALRVQLVKLERGKQSLRTHLDRFTRLLG
jgi:hypothetical protein